MLCNKITIRPSTSGDGPAIRKVETVAFGRKAEANLVDQLIPAPQRTISLVAECDGRIIGHLLLTEINASLRAMALAPLAVVPEFREMQVGSELVRSGITLCRGSGYDVIFVLGDVLYYERFGFSSRLADPFDVKWQGRTFLALELRDNALKGKKGPLNYPEPFLVL